MARIRSAFLVCLLTSLVGCLSDAPAPTATDPVALAEEGGKILFDDTVLWWDPESDDQEERYGGLYDAVSQTFAQACLFHGEPYHSNLQLSTRGLVKGIPNGTTALEITLSWTSDDYSGQSLALAYRPGAGHPYQETGLVGNGGVLEVSVDADGWEAPGSVSRWDFWVCITDKPSELGDPGFEPFPFLGSVTVTIEALNQGIGEAA